MELGLNDDDDALDDEPPPILHYYPLDYALSTWYDHRKNGTWPEGTCYNDQDPQLVLMWDSITARYNWLFQQEERAKRDADEFDKLLKGDGKKQDIGSLFHG